MPTLHAQHDCQLTVVFCDLGTPGQAWNVYAELRDQLTQRGLPTDSVRFVHQAKNDTELARLFAACRTGHVAVLVGSTEKMGVGTNVQDRAIALHHLDAPWRPADVAQREGRIIRQGNLNEEVQVIRYLTEPSFDGYSWQTLERKARFIRDVMSPTWTPARSAISATQSCRSAKPKRSPPTTRS